MFINKWENKNWEKQLLAAMKNDGAVNFVLVDAARSANEKKKIKANKASTTSDVLKSAIREFFLWIVNNCQLLHISLWWRENGHWCQLTPSQGKFLH
jgi:hypothetical protein